MIALLDNGHDHDAEQSENEIGGPVGQLLTPLTRYVLRDPSRPWAIDNGAYTEFDGKAFDVLLTREHGKPGCLFVACPDVVGSARRTLEVFPFWAPGLKAQGWPVALVAQDGQQDLPIPWREVDAIFIGGSTTFKISPYAIAICKAARILGKWVHVGRINDAGRFSAFEDLADSCDGTGLSRYTHMREAVRRRHHQEQLCLSQPQ